MKEKTKNLYSTLNTEWNHHPKIPLDLHPYWLWPPKPLVVIRWFIANFLTSSDRVIYIIYSFIIALWLMPFSPNEASLGFDWTLSILFRNLLAVFIVVGGYIFGFMV